MFVFNLFKTILMMFVTIFVFLLRNMFIALHEQKLIFFSLQLNGTYKISARL